ncbi:MAG: hypothetical protein E6K17_00470 [Methanobacteriota archaeon]|nr:MAG: hypothetical protein E6K17_00470 [Euryarchaeota archaeon]
MASRTPAFRKLTKLDIAFLLILVGVGGRLLLLRVANVETVLAASMLAGAFLGWRYSLLVTLAVMGISDALIYALGYGGELGLMSILGLTGFTWSGMVFAGLIGAATGRRRVLFTTRSMALLATVSIPATLLFDVWTAFGDWLFIAGPRGLSLATVYYLQIPFTLIHLASSIVFVPLFGSIFSYLTPAPSHLPMPEPTDGEN